MVTAIIKGGELMNYYLTALTRGNRVIERGWMLAATDRELIDYARTMGYGIDITYLGRADLRACFPTVQV